MGPDLAPGIPSRIGKYEIQGLLGRGGVGDVYKGYDRDLVRTVAIKVMIAREHASEDVIARFMREARAAAALHHSGIVQTHDLRVEGNLHYIVMEWVDGKSLAEILKERRLAPREALETALQMTLALQEAHERGIIHRDIKPSNILVDSKGRPKLADFGLAVSLEDKDRLTETGDILGTAWYMSPEQAFGSSEELDPRTDLYSLGAVLYEMLVGRPPFDGQHVWAVMRRIERDDAVPPSTAVPSLGTRYDALVLRALEKNPDRRYATAAEFSSAIRGALDGAPGETIRPATTERRSAKPMIGIALLALFLLAAGAAIWIARGGGGIRAGWERGARVERARAGVEDPLREGESADQRRRALQQASGELEDYLKTNPRDGEASYWLSRILLESGVQSRALALASGAIESGFDTPAARSQRLYAAFLRYFIFLGNTGFTSLHPRGADFLKVDLEKMASAPESPDRALAELVGLSFERRYQDVLSRTESPTRDRRVQVLRWNAQLGSLREQRDPVARSKGAGAAFSRLLSAVGEEADPLSLFLASQLMTLKDYTADPLKFYVDRLKGVKAVTPDVFLWKAVLLERSGDHHRFLEDLRNVQALDPEDTLALLYQKVFLMTRLRPNVAEADQLGREIVRELEPLVSRGSPCAAPHLLVGAGYLIVGNRKKAEQTFQACFARYGDPASWNPGLVTGMESLFALVRWSGKEGPGFAVLAGRFLLELEIPSGLLYIEEARLALEPEEAGERFSMSPDEYKSMKRTVYRELLIRHIASGKKLDKNFESYIRTLKSLNDTIEAMKEDPRLRPVVELDLFRLTWNPDSMKRRGTD